MCAGFLLFFCTIEASFSYLGHHLENIHKLACCRSVSKCAREPSSAQTILDQPALGQPASWPQTNITTQPIHRLKRSNKGLLFQAIKFWDSLLHKQWVTDMEGKMNPTPKLIEGHPISAQKWTTRTCELDEGPWFFQKNVILNLLRFKWVFS